MTIPHYLCLEKVLALEDEIQEIELIRCPIQRHQIPKLKKELKKERKLLHSEWEGERELYGKMGKNGRRVGKKKAKAQKIAETSSSATK